MKANLIINHIVNWLKEYKTTNGLSGFVVGISGGIDSAVTSTLCAKTGDPTLVFELPIHQEIKQTTRANKHILWLKEQYANVYGTKIDLSDSFDLLKTTLLTEQETSSNVQLALANVRARIRMITLYYFAAIRNFIVVGTGNKVEDFGVGFFTKYGDGGVDISPIADLLKSEVCQIGNYMGITKEILNAPPTDGLWGDDRTDEDQLGASYDELEWAMKNIEIQDRKKYTMRQIEVLELFKQLHLANKHKMIEIPICKIPNSLKR